MAEGADSLDRASDLEQAFRDKAIEASRVQFSIPQDFDGKTCYDCGLDIPIARLELGKFTCVYCQERRESIFRLSARRMI